MTAIHSHLLSSIYTVAYLIQHICLHDIFHIEAHCHSLSALSSSLFSLSTLHQQKKNLKYYYLAKVHFFFFTGKRSK